MQTDKIPDEIYLNIDDEAGETKPSTWSVARMFDTDIKYIRSDAIKAEIQKLIDKLDSGLGRVEAADNIKTVLQEFVEDVENIIGYSDIEKVYNYELIKEWLDK